MDESTTPPSSSSPGETISIGPGECVLAFDVGGTDTKSALVAADGRLLGLRRTRTPRSTTDPAGAVLEHVAALADELLSTNPGHHPAAAGLSVPGLVDEAAGIARYASNL